MYLNDFSFLFQQNRKQSGSTRARYVKKKMYTLPYVLSSWSGLKTIRPYANPALVDTALVN
jgi:hypothetical protein